MFRDLFSEAYRNIPAWVVARTYKENSNKVSRLVYEAIRLKDEQDKVGYRERMGKLYQETLMALSGQASTHFMQRLQRESHNGVIRQTCGS